MRFLDSTSIHADPVTTLGAAAAHYGLAMSAHEAQAIAAGPVFARHSKSLAPYTAEDRARDYAQVRAAHDDEIGKVVIWARAVADSFGISLEPPFPLMPCGPVIAPVQ